MRVCVIGGGYVGLVAGAGFAEVGHVVRCVDIDKAKMDLLNSGKIPIYETGLDALVRRNIDENRLSFSTDFEQGTAAADVVIIAVGTPENEDGSANLTYIMKAAGTIADHLTGFTVVACKSTVPVGTNHKIRDVIAQKTDADFAVVSNPEFLREGAAVEDFMTPPRVVIGTDDHRAEQVMRELYMPLYGYDKAHERIIRMDIRSAEMTKYVANAYLATRITFINEMAGLCEKVGANIADVRTGAGTDPRIGLDYFSPGCGYGGSCFPKDVRALLRVAGDLNYQTSVLEAVDSTNVRQKLVPFEKLKDAIDGELAGKTIAVWGLAFKPQTDDVRESAAIPIVYELLQAGAHVQVHDPVANANFQREVTDKPRFYDNALDAATDADGLVVLTAWRQYIDFDLARLASAMKGSVIVDGRNLWSTRKIPQGWQYQGIGRR